MGSHPKYHLARTDLGGINGTLAIASHWIEKLVSTLNRVLKNTHVCARVLVSVVGHIISTGPVTGNLARIMSRHCQISIDSAAEWDTPFKIDQYCLHELKLWHTNVPAINSRSFTESLATNQTIYSDASATACGAFIEGTTHAAHRMFSSSEQKTSSNYRELLVIHYALQAFQPLLKNCNVKLFTDSKMAVRITEVGSMKFEYQLAIGIFPPVYTQTSIWTYSGYQEPQTSRQTI